MKKHTLYIIYLLLTGLSMSVSSRADSQLSFTQIGLTQGMPSHINYIYEDKNGLIWLGTSEGLRRYDGQRLKLYPISTPTDTLGQENILQMLEDKEGRLWLVSNKGLFCYSTENDRFVLPPSVKQILSVESACQVEDGVIFGGGDKLYKYTYKSGRMEELPGIPVKNFYIRRIGLWTPGTLICTDSNNKLLSYNLNTGEVHPIASDEWNKIYDFCIGPEQHVWVADYNNGIKKIDKKGRLIAHYSVQNSDITSNIVLCVSLIQGKIWAGTDGGGICVIDPKTGKIDTYTYDSGDIHSLPVNTILYLHGNSQGKDIWAGTTRGGLINIRWNHMRTYPGVPLGSDKGLSEKTVLSLYQEPGSDILWIGTDGGGINSLDTKTHTFRHYPNTWGDKIVSICNYSPQKLLLSSFSKGFFLFDKANGHKEPLDIGYFTLNNYVRYSGLPTNLYSETDNTILLLANPIARYHIREKRMEEIIQLPDYSITGMLCPIGQDKENSYFYDSQNIYKIKKDENRLLLVYSGEMSLRINAAGRDDNGNFWIANDKGLFKWNGQELTAVPCSIFSKCQTILCDHKGRVWIGAGQELLSYRPQTDKFILYGEADGIRKNEYLSKPVLQANNKGLYIGGVNGLLYIDSEQENEQTPLSSQQHIVVTDFWVNGKNCMNRLSDNRIVLPWDSQNIRISFLVQGDDILRPRLFQYSLDDKRQNVLMNNDAELQIPSLAAGTYPISVEYTRKDGGWSEGQQVLTLVILPPWYKSWWFITILLLLTCVLIYVLIRYILKRKDNRLQTQKHSHQVDIQPLPEENNLNNADNLFMEKLHQVIADNLDNPQLDIPFLCNLMGISRTSLYNKLKVITGMGANDYINKIRIERAMKLIKESELNFTEISEKVGFTSPRYFSTTFKQYTGKTPTQFKKE